MQTDHSPTTTRQRRRKKKNFRPSSSPASPVDKEHRQNRRISSSGGSSSSGRKRRTKRPPPLQSPHQSPSRAEVGQDGLFMSQETREERSDLHRMKSQLYDDSELLDLAEEENFIVVAKASDSR